MKNITELQNKLTNIDNKIVHFSKIRDEIISNIEFYKDEQSIIRDVFNNPNRKNTISHVRALSPELFSDEKKKYDNVKDNISIAKAMSENELSKLEVDLDETLLGDYYNIQAENEELNKETKEAILNIQNLEHRLKYINNLIDLLEFKFEETEKELINIMSNRSKSTPPGFGGKKKKQKIKNCCTVNRKMKKCLRKDGKLFSLPRRFSKKKCKKGPIKGFTMKASCAPYKFCKKTTGGKNNLYIDINNLDTEYDRPWLKEIKDLNSNPNSGVKIIDNLKDRMSILEKIDPVFNLTPEFYENGANIYDYLIVEYDMDEYFDYDLNLRIKSIPEGEKNVFYKIYHIKHCNDRYPNECSGRLLLPHYIKKQITHNNPYAKKNTTYSVKNKLKNKNKKNKTKKRKKDENIFTSNKSQNIRISPNSIIDEL